MDGTDINFPGLPENWIKLAIFVSRDKPYDGYAQVMLDTGAVGYATLGRSKFLHINLHHPWSETLRVWGKDGMANKELRLTEEWNET